ncbi:bifunctional nuclease family protein [Collinsella sp. AGMB00827]|uniref:Bifunctional nuclease family protein n=1 Tax=Collinsella ureilytica TaxID=2869515 RepID=A0ABS7MK99_9ACTN|nr:bifunctional nuclease family protein [Collinsella urealyticum]MBY4797793.1 bifunctional nuclease family protein [Collinsella urealyticum]
MIRVDIETIIMADGPVPSVVILRERGDRPDPTTPLRALSIRTGTVEAASIGRGIDRSASKRPITHDLMTEVISKLGAKLERVEIDRVDAPIFYASLIMVDAEQEHGSSTRELRIDARPSDALALAVRSNTPIYVDDDVMNRAGNIVSGTDSNTDDEIGRFDDFVKNLSPDDF